MKQFSNKLIIKLLKTNISWGINQLIKHQKL